jgi:hypothetical protein
VNTREIGDGCCYGLCHLCTIFLQWIRKEKYCSDNFINLIAEKVAGFQVD